MNKLKVLASAYAFNPIVSAQLHPGEDLTGWKLVEQIRRFHDVWVITHSYNRNAIMNSLFQEELQKINVRFISLPNWMKLMYKVEFGQRICYYFWQLLLRLKSFTWM